MYTQPPKIGPWLSVEDACESLGLGVDEFCSLLAAHACDIPHRFADSPEGNHDGDLKISPLAMIDLYLIRGLFSQAQEMIRRMEFAQASSQPDAFNASRTLQALQ